MFSTTFVPSGREELSAEENVKQEHQTCSRKEGHSLQVEQSWPCRHCTYHNHRKSERCVMCGVEKKCAEDIDLARMSHESTSESEQEAEEVTLFTIVPCKRILNGALRGIFALVGSFAGALAGAVAANSSRGGLVRGIGLGALAGAIVSMEALETSPLLFEDEHSSPSTRRRRREARSSTSTPTASGSSSGQDTRGENNRASSSTRAASSILGLLSPLSGLQIRIMHWRMLSVDAGLDFALREMRVPPEAIFRFSSTNNSNSNRYTYPTSDTTAGDLEDARASGMPLVIRNRTANDASPHPPVVPGLSPYELSKVPFMTLDSKSLCKPCVSSTEGKTDEGDAETDSKDPLSNGKCKKDDIKSNDVVGPGQCAICFEFFKEGENVRLLPTCDHYFHARCLDPWLRKKGSCPMCRRVVSTQDHTS